MSKAVFKRPAYRPCPSKEVEAGLSKKRGHPDSLEERKGNDPLDVHSPTERDSDTSDE